MPRPVRERGQSVKTNIAPKETVPPRALQQLKRESSQFYLQLHNGNNNTELDDNSSLGVLVSEEGQCEFADEARPEYSDAVVLFSECQVKQASDLRVSSMVLKSFRPWMSLSCSMPGISLS